MVDVSILRIGPCEDNPSAKILRTALMAYFSNPSDSPEESKTSLSAKDLDSFLIQNKYFHAQVRLKDIDKSETTEDISKNTIKNKEDGVILVFDGLQSNPDRPAANSSNQATFDAMALAHETATTKHNCGDLLRLCVGISLAELSADEWRGSKSEEEYSRRILWCLDHGYEYVEANLSQEAQTKGHNVRDKEGFARIVEAIQGTMWSSAVMSKNKGKELQELRQDAADTMKRPTTTSTDNPDLQDTSRNQEENAYLPPNIEASTLPLNEEKSEETNHADASDPPEAEETTQQPPNTGSGVDEKMNPEALSDAQTEHVFGEMESVLKEARRIRDASKAGSLNDDERRERAGDAALALVNLMSSLGFDEDGDDEVDSSDEESR